MKKLSLIIVTICLLVIYFAAASGAETQNPDRLGVQRLQKARSDITKPHSMSFYLYFTDQSSAVCAARVLHAEGFEDLSVSTYSGKTWLVQVNRTMIPAFEELAQLRLRFDRICKEFEGEYDGWAALPVRP